MLLVALAISASTADECCLQRFNRKTFPLSWSHHSRLSISSLDSSLFQHLLYVRSTIPIYSQRVSIDPRTTVMRTYVRKSGSFDRASVQGNWWARRHRQRKDARWDPSSHHPVPSVARKNTKRSIPDLPFTPYMAREFDVYFLPWQQLGA